ncbi:MAG TPA: TetR/AcrR family transcriptional regulator [Acidimicrobiales bacterium]|nr:TetR/AcrR family transcriptional regulator [Acidimicrobiales bacterium]
MRTSATRRSLLDAAVEVLVENGYSKFSVAAVADRAGMTTGALFYNFHNRSEFIAEMCKYLFDLLEKEFISESISGLSHPGDRAAALVDALWKLYCDPRMRAALELYGVSRTDPELAKLLAEIDQSRSPRHVEIAAELIGANAADSTRLSAVVHVVVLAIQGMALDQLTGGNLSTTDEVLSLLRELARGLVEIPR